MGLIQELNNLSDQQIERRQINICRVLCIFFMMSVHVNPGLSADSVVTTGDYYLLGYLWGNVLGRASVAVLSFISGYLLWRSMRYTPLTTIAIKKAQTLILPMLFWNMAFVVLVIIKAYFLGAASGYTDIFNAQGLDLLGAFTGLTGPTANLSLFFLRDLFVSILLLRLIAPVIERWPLAILLLLTGATIFDALEPLVYRPAITLFAALGVVLAHNKLSLADLARLRFVSVSLVLMLSAFMLIEFLPMPVELDSNSKNILLRGALLVLLLVVTAWLARSSFGHFLEFFEERIYETYLSHVLIIGVLWSVWTALVGNALGSSYIIFFLLAPAFAMAGGRLLGAFIDFLPGFLQMIIRGKVKK